MDRRRTELSWSVSNLFVVSERSVLLRASGRRGRRHPPPHRGAARRCRRERRLERFHRCRAPARGLSSHSSPTPLSSPTSATFLRSWSLRSKRRSGPSSSSREMNLISSAGNRYRTECGDTAWPTLRQCGLRDGSHELIAAPSVVPGREVDVEARFEIDRPIGIGRDTYWNDALAMSQRSQLLAATDLRLERAGGEQGETMFRCIQLAFDFPRPAASPCSRAASSQTSCAADVRFRPQTARQRATVPVRIRDENACCHRAASARAAARYAPI